MTVYTPLHRPHAPASPTSHRERVAGLQPASACDAFRITFPHFPLDVRLRGIDRAPPCVVVDETGSILHANTPAIDLGARPGMPAVRAQAFAPALRVIGRDRRGEAELTAHILRWLRGRGFEVRTVFAPGSASAPELFVLYGPGASPHADVRHELRAFGVRHACAPARVADPVPCAAPIAASRPSADCAFTATLTLPWALTRPHELHPAIGRLLESLRLIGDAERLTATHVQWTFDHADGTRDHHAFALGGAIVSVARLGAWIRERLHRMPATAPWCAVTLKAGR